MPQPKLTPQQARENLRLSNLRTKYKRRYPHLTPDQVEQRIRAAARRTAYKPREDKARFLSTLPIKPIPPAPVGKRFPSVVGQQRCFIAPPDQKPYEILIDPALVVQKRAKYEELGYRFAVSVV